MFIDLPVLADLATLHKKRQTMIDENLRQQNRRRREFQYEVGGEVFIKTVDPKKLDFRAHGPYTITRVFQNGTIEVHRNPQVVERLNV